VQVAWITQFSVRRKDLGDVSYTSRVIASLSQISLPWQPEAVMIMFCLISFNSPTPKPPYKAQGSRRYVLYKLSHSQFSQISLLWQAGSVIWLTSFDSLTPNPPKISLPWQCGSVEVEFFLTSVNSRPRKHAPPYLADDIHLVSEGHRRRLRSSTDRSCAVPRTHNIFGDRSFAVAQPRVWNSFQTHLRDEDIIYTTVSGVNSKRFCFNVASGAQWDFC